VSDGSVLSNINVFDDDDADGDNNNKIIIMRIYI
jgi:hypothetical protein